MTKIKKTTNKGYYLGVNKENRKVYLKKPSWDCDWYWGFGYLEEYNNAGRPTLYSFSHWNYEFKDQVSFEAIKQGFKQLTLTDKELWILCDFMKSFYVLKEMAEICHMGYSHFTSTAKELVDLSDKTLEEKINKELLPNIFEQIANLFKDEGDQ